MSSAIPTTPVIHANASKAAGRESPSPIVPLKNPLIAAVLAFLLPGAGHFYQGRMFKAVLYFVCILSIFGFGVSIGEGRPVYMYYYNRVDDGHQDIFMDLPADIIVLSDIDGNGRRKLSQRSLNYGFFAQVMVGLPALPGYFQVSRYRPEDNTSLNQTLEKGFEDEFEGYLIDSSTIDRITKYPARGKIQLKFANTEVASIIGQFNGTVTIAGRDEPVVLELGGGKTALGGDVFASPRRGVVADVRNPSVLKLTDVQLIGSTPRPFKDWYGVPLEDATMQLLNQDLGKHWELSMVFTWIAGLLNILAIWDAAEGPAYGRGDEDDEDEIPVNGPEPSTA